MGETRHRPQGVRRPRNDTAPLSARIRAKPNRRQRPLAKPSTAIGMLRKARTLIRDAWHQLANDWAAEYVTNFGQYRITNEQRDRVFIKQVQGLCRSTFFISQSLNEDIAIKHYTGIFSIHSASRPCFSSQIAWRSLSMISSNSSSVSPVLRKSS